jgi:hypothetical protein
MRKILAASALVVSLAGLAFATSNGAMAQANVSFDVGNVAIGYSDGYWDRGHVWHQWAQPAHRDAYRTARGAEYHEWNHDREKDMGWHERH